VSWAPSKVRAGVVGAGLGGAMVSLYLARLGYEVEVHERRPDIRKSDSPGPSMNLGLSLRGIEALQRVGLAERVLALSIPMAGRMVHDLRGGTRFEPYGRDRTQVIHAIKRNDINAVLLDAAASYGNLGLRFERRCLRLDRESGTAIFRHEATGEETQDRADFWVGADGLFSPVRWSMQRGLRADYCQEYLDWGWKELRIPPGREGRFQLAPNVFHLWPRGGCMLFAHPNLDGSFTCSFVLPFSGAKSFETLSDPDRVLTFFAETFPDIVSLVPDLGEQFLARPIVPLATIRTSPWFYADRVVLLGDSAHAVVPFYAQGMNAAFEDCAVLSACLARHRGERAAAFQEYQTLRQRNTDALAEISKQNFLELRDKVRSPWLRTRRRLDLLLSKLLADRWSSLHAAVTNSSIPYAEALERARRQDHALAWTGAGLALVGLAALLRAVSAALH
jgi:kynurenine 3-monooxygenase